MTSTFAKQVGQYCKKLFAAKKIVPFLRGKLVGAPLKMMTTCHDVTQHTNLWRRAGLMLHISLEERINSQKILTYEIDV